MREIRQAGSSLLLCEPLSPSRRAVLGAAGALFAWTFAPRMLFAAGSRDVRFVCIVLRGGLDGIAAVAPLGDPDYQRQRGDLALRINGSHPAIRLDDFFALHPSMPNFARLFRSGQAAIVHAANTPYAKRSHFDGQDVLESGYAGPGRVDSGWLNRLIATLPAGERIASRGALGIGAIPPLVVRGKAPVIGWAPTQFQRPGEDLVQRVLDLYAERDPELSLSLSRGLNADGLARHHNMGAAASSIPAASNPAGMKLIAEGAARLIAAEDGPRIAALALEGWDTHANEGGATGQLATRLGGLDDAIAAFETVLGEKWRDTMLMVTTEFGRTVRINGTSGTDHGVGTVILLAGGAVKGGRVIADWPGLADKVLVDGRDLAATTDLRAVAKGMLTELFDVSPRMLAEQVFPDSAAVAPMKGLIG